MAVQTGAQRPCASLTHGGLQSPEKGTSAKRRTFGDQPFQRLRNLSCAEWTNRHAQTKARGREPPALRLGAKSGDKGARMTGASR